MKDIQHVKLSDSQHINVVLVEAEIYSMSMSMRGLSLTNKIYFLLIASYVVHRKVTAEN